MAPPNEPTNAEILTLLRQHMDTSITASREQTAQYARLDSQMGEMRGSIATLANKQLDFEQRLAREERAREATHAIAIKARETCTDLDGVVKREVANVHESVGQLAGETSQIAAAMAVVKADTHKQNGTLANQDAALAQIRSDTSELVSDAKYRKEEQARWKARLAFIYGAAKFIGAIAVAVGAVYGVAEVLFSHIK